MASWNGLVASIVNPGLSGTSHVSVNTVMPAKFFPHGQFAVSATEGVSGQFNVNVIGSIGGATFIIARRVGVAAIGSFPVSMRIYGESGSPIDMGVPRPIGVDFQNALGSTAVAGFTASVYFAGEY